MGCWAGRWTQTNGFVCVCFGFYMSSAKCLAMSGCIRNFFICLFLLLVVCFLFRYIFSLFASSRLGRAPVAVIHEVYVDLFTFLISLTDYF